MNFYPILISSIKRKQSSNERRKYSALKNYFTWSSINSEAFCVFSVYLFGIPQRQNFFSGQIISLFLSSSNYHHPKEEKLSQIIFKQCLSIHSAKREFLHEISLRRSKKKCRSTQRFPLDRFLLNLQISCAHWQKPLMAFCVKRQDDFSLLCGARNDWR